MEKVSGANLADLKEIARNMKFRGWSKLRKAELEEFLLRRLWPQNIMEEPVPQINAPVLTPEKAPFPKTKKSEVESEYKFMDWLEWLKKEPKLRPPTQVQEWLRGIQNTFRATAMRGFLREAVIRGKMWELPRDFYRRVRPQIVSLMRQNSMSKVKLMLNCVMSKTDLNTGEYIETNPTFLSKNKIILIGTDLFETSDEMFEEVMVNMVNYQKDGSNLQFERVNELVIPFASFQPLKGSSFIKLPKELELKKAIINIKNDDVLCFKWAVTRSLNMVENHPERVTSTLFTQSQKLDWGGLSFPTPLHEISRFEKRNPGIAVHVFGYDKKEWEIFPLRRSKVIGRNIDLLLLTEKTQDGKRFGAISKEEDERRKTHYCCIKSMSRLLGSQVRNHNEKTSFCRNCLNHFSEDRLKKHEEYCLNNEAVKIQMPGEGETVSFRDYEKKLKMPFAIYADMEAVLEKVPMGVIDPTSSFTLKIQKHRVVSFAFHAVSPFLKKKPVLFRARRDDEDVGLKFFQTLSEFVREIQNEFKTPKNMEFGRENVSHFNNAKICWICEKEFSKEDKKVRDHCHFTGKFRGAAHHSCNVKFRVPNFTPVFFHNLKGYDSHFIVKALGEEAGAVKCIANNEEQFISFSKSIILRNELRGDKVVPVKHEIRFLDSNEFMKGSLASHVRNLRDENFIETKKVFKKNWELFKRKGIFPYEWLDSVKKFEETNLPEADAFYSKLTGEGVSEEDLKHAFRVWKEMNMQNFGNFHDAYLKSDVTLLADVMEQFRNVCNKEYELDPLHYYTVPGYAWSAALKTSKAELELLTDPDKLLFFEKGIRGGISTIIHRRAQANNKYMQEYDPSKPSVFIPYWDANALYSWAMLHPLPVGEFEWMSESELKKWKQIPCILEVDVDIPVELHDKFNDFPPLPEKIKIGNCQKLIPNLWNKRGIIVHYKLLKQALEMGCKLMRVKRGVKFREEPWLKSFIEMNSRLRQAAENKFEKDFFKLMNNSVFGKTMENVRKRRDIELVYDFKKFRKLVAKPNYDHATIVTENMVTVHKKKTRIEFRKPIFVGQAILDISKTCMFEFHYGYVKEKWGEKAKLCFTDTDSLLYRIETEDLFEDISGVIKARFDTSDFAKDHEKVVDGTIAVVNKKVPGLMKDESAGKQIKEFVGLKAKCYTIKMDEKGGIKKCKGVKKSTVKKMRHEEWVSCLESGMTEMRGMVCIRSSLHNVWTMVVNKVALSSNDDKRFVRANGIDTLAWGHEKIENASAD